MNKSEAERMKSLLVDAVTTLCRSGMRFNEALRVEGLLAITVDESDIMVINVNKTFENPVAAKKNKTGQNSEENVKESENDSDLSEGSACSVPAKRRRRHKHHSRRQKRDHEDMHDDSDVQAHQLSHETEASSSSSKRFKSSCLQADESYSDITHVSQYSSEDYDVKTNPPIKIEIDSDSESDDKAQLNAQLFGLNSEGEHTLTGTPVDQSVLTDAMTVPVSVYSAANYPTQGSANMTFPGTSNQEYYQQMAASELSSSPGAKIPLCAEYPEVCITKQELERALLVGNHQAEKVVKALLTLLFSDHELAYGKAVGQRTNVKANVKTSALNPAKLSAIKRYVTLKFRDQEGVPMIDDVKFTRIVNVKCGTARRKLLGVRSRPKTDQLLPCSPPENSSVPTNQNELGADSLDQLGGSPGDTINTKTTETVQK